MPLARFNTFLIAISYQSITSLHSQANKLSSISLILQYCFSTSVASVANNHWHNLLIIPFSDHTRQKAVVVSGSRMILQTMVLLVFYFKHIQGAVPQCRFIDTSSRLNDSSESNNSVHPAPSLMMPTTQVSDSVILSTPSTPELETRSVLPALFEDLFINGLDQPHLAICPRRTKMMYLLSNVMIIPALDSLTLQVFSCMTQRRKFRQVSGKPLLPKLCRFPSVALHHLLYIWNSTGFSASPDNRPLPRL